MKCESGLKNVPGLQYVPFLQQHDCSFVDLADLSIGTLHLPKCVVQVLAFKSHQAGLVDDRVGMLPCSQRIVAKGAISIAL